jgi:hypothetical protein
VTTRRLGDGHFVRQDRENQLQSCLDLTGSLLLLKIEVPVTFRRESPARKSDAHQKSEHRALRGPPTGRRPEILSGSSDVPNRRAGANTMTGSAQANSTRPNQMPRVLAGGLPNELTADGLPRQPRVTGSADNGQMYCGAPDRSRRSSARWGLPHEPAREYLYSPRMCCDQNR